jgi:hypothetical protein
MEQERQRLTIETINEGALLEQFNRALDRVLENLADINTTDNAREINLKLQIKPNDDRTFLDIKGGVTTKTAGQMTVKSTADLQIDERGRPAAFVRRHKQLEIPFNVTRLNKGGAND